MPFMVLLVLRFGGNAVVLGAIGAAFWAAQLVGATWLGMLSDRIGRKRVLLRSQLGAMAAWTIFLVALHVPRIDLIHVHGPILGTFVLSLPLVLITLARVSDGLFNGSISVASAYVADVADEDARKQDYARLGAASSFGFVIGPVLAGFIAHGDQGMTYVVVLAFVLAGLAALLIWRRLPALPPRPDAAVVVAQRGGMRAHKPLGTGCADAVRHPHKSVREILGDAEVRPLIAIYFLIYLAFSIFTAAFPVHAVVDVGWSSMKLGTLYMSLALALALTEAVFLPRVTRKLATAEITAGGSVILVCAYLLMSLHSTTALLLGGVLYGVGNGFMWPSYLVMLSRSGPPEAQGAVQGVGSSTGSLASIVGTLAGGILYVAIGVATFYVSALSVALATGILVSRSWGARYASCTTA
jgi:MFS family permease